MPKQNRVTPFGEIIAAPARGRLMGNRGCLHDTHQQIIRHHQGKRWIICRLQFKGRRREVMSPGQYTELFFLDEATALAAGHRPCAECSRPRFEKFRRLWAQANPELARRSKPLATEIDAALHKERINSMQEKVTHEETLGALPEGSFVVLENRQPYLWFRGLLLMWTAEEYGERLAATSDSRVQVLTPRSIVKTFAQGYAAEIHSSALAESRRKSLHFA
jgi:hypothetical protein